MWTGSRLEPVRESRGLSQEPLAPRIRSYQVTLSRLETPGAAAEVQTLKRLAKTVRVASLLEHERRIER